MAKRQVGFQTCDKPAGKLKRIDTRRVCGKQVSTYEDENGDRYEYYHPPSQYSTGWYKPFFVDEPEGGDR